MKIDITKVKDTSTFISSIGIIVGLIVGVYAYFYEYKVNQTSMTENIKIVQRMALKGVIYNEEIPLTERSLACDDYLHLGYNSYTKKYCENMIKGVVMK